MDTTLTTSINDLTASEAAFAGGFLGSIIVIGLIISVLIIIAGWRIFEKAGEKGWKILIPIYDLYILFKICKLKNWFWAVFCIIIITSIMISVNMPPTIQDTYGNYILDPDVELSQYPAFIAGTVICSVVEIIATIVIAIRLAKAFGKGIGYTLGIIFFPYIFTMILGYGKAKYSAKNLK